MSKVSKILWGTAFVVLVFLIVALFSPYKISSFLSEFGQGPSKKEMQTKEKKSPAIPEVKKEQFDPTAPEESKTESITEDLSVSTDESQLSLDGKDIVYKNLEYAKAGSKSLKLDIYLPQSSSGKVPLLIWIHGGGWIEGDKESCPSKTFTENGYAMACIEYRLAARTSAGECPGNLIFPAQIHDVKAAVRWLRKNADKYNFDSENFAAMGDSSGAHLAALLGISYGAKELEGTENTEYSDKVQAVVDYYGPVDATQSPPDIVFSDNPCKLSLAELNSKYGGEATQFFYWTRAWGLFLGGSLADPNIIQMAKKASPLTYIDENDPPFLIFHGKTDGLIPDGQSKMLVAGLKGAGVEVTFVNTEGGHSYGDPSIGVEVFPEYLTPTLSFLDKHLKGR